MWVKKSPAPEIFWHFFPNGWEFLVQILHAYYTFLSMLDYKLLFSYLQLWQSCTILLSATTIICSKCPPSIETHAGWSHLKWHNFVKVGDNLIKICTLAYLWTFSRRVKFVLKFLTVCGKCQKMPACVSADGGHLAHMWWIGWNWLECVGLYGMEVAGCRLQTPFLPRNAL